MRLNVVASTVSVCVALCTSPIVASAQTNETTPRSDMAVEQARTALSSAGFELEPTTSWQWTSPPVTTFRVQDAARGRIALVLVYHTATDAALAREQGSASVVGYGPPAWRGNIAIVQTTRSELDRQYQLQSDRDNGVMGSETYVIGEPGAVAFAVDLDLQQALDLSAANL